MRRKKEIIGRDTLPLGRREKFCFAHLSIKKAEASEATRKHEEERTKRIRGRKYDQRTTNKKANENIEKEEKRKRKKRMIQ